VKRLAAIALSAVTLAAACGGSEFSPVAIVDPTNTFYLTVDTPEGAAVSGPNYNTSCRNPAASVEDAGGNTANALDEALAAAYDADFGVVHLCAGTYETDRLVEFPNLGSIIIEGDGIDKTIISGDQGTDHPLLAMVPVCPDDVCPSSFNVLTLKDLTLSNGVGGPDDLEMGFGVGAGGAVTAPLIATERVKFSNNSGYCGGAIALYGWSLMILTDESWSNGPTDDTEEAAVAWLSLMDVNHQSTITDTVFVDNSASFGGAISGIPIFDTEVPDELGIIACLNPGPLKITGSTFSRNVSHDTNLGGGAVITFDTRLILFIEFLDADYYAAWLESEAARSPWLDISGSTFSENSADQSGGAVLAIGNAKISNSRFSNNYAAGADGSGGAIAGGGQIVIKGTSFTGNSAASGGAIAFEDVFGEGGLSHNVLTGNKFTRNVASDQGGAISGWANEGTARGNSFISNRAPLGSAVAVTKVACSRAASRQLVRDWRGNTFRLNRGGRVPVECYAVPPV